MARLRTILAENVDPPFWIGRLSMTGPYHQFALLIIFDLRIYPSRHLSNFSMPSMAKYTMLRDMNSIPLFAMLCDKISQELNSISLFSFRILF
jgi:hypothetical protein